MVPKHPGGRPKADRRAVKAWQEHRQKARPLKTFAEYLGISQPAVSKWQQVPVIRLQETAAFLGVEPSALRPDLYPARMPWNDLLNT